MDTNGVGWLGAIIIGGVAGWLAELFMKSDMGVFMNIILGIVGAVVLTRSSALFGVGSAAVSAISSSASSAPASSSPWPAPSAGVAASSSDCMRQGPSLD